MINISEILPIRFYETFDGLQFLPYKNQATDQKLIDEWLIDTEISLQFEVTTGYTAKLYSIVDELPVLVSSSFIDTPSGWATTDIIGLNYTPNEEKTYNFLLEFIDTSNNIVKQLSSDCISVKYRLTDYVKVQWKNSENKGGIVYNSLIGYYPTTFVRGQMISLTGEGENETMTNSDGQAVMLKSTQKKGYFLKGWLLSNYQAIQMFLVSGCDLVKINSNPVIFEKQIAIENIEEEINNTISGTAFESDWDKNESYDIEPVSLATELFLTIELSNYEYSYIFRTNKNVKYSVNGSAFIFDTDTSLRDVKIQASPNSIIEIYTTLSGDIGESRGGRKVTINDIGSITDISDLFNTPNSNLIEVNIDADTSNVTNFNSLFINCKNLVNVNGISEDSFSSATSIAYMCYECESLESFTIFMTSLITNANSAFGNCKKLYEIRGIIDTTSSNPVSMLSSCFNLAYPKYGTYSESFSGGLLWYHPKDCDITVEMQSVSSVIGVTPDPTGIQIYTDTFDWLSTAGFTFVGNAGENVLFGFNIPTGCTGLKFDNSYDNIKHIVVDNLGSVTSINSFVANFKQIESIIIKNTLTNIEDASRAFLYANTIPNYFNVPNAINLESCFGAVKGNIISIVTSSNLVNCKNMFSEATIPNILGIIDTTGASDKTDMFRNSLISKPNNTEQIALESTSGYIYEY